MSHVGYPTKDQPDEQSNDQADRQPTKQSVDWPEDRHGGQPDNQLDNQASRQPHKESVSARTLDPLIRSNMQVFIESGR